MQKLSVQRLTRIGLMAALTAIGAFLVVPTQPVPLTMQPFFVALAGVVLGPVDGALSQLVYLGVGAIGLPVFAGLRGGVAHLAGPTGGFLIGFVVCAFITGLVAGSNANLPYWRALTGMLAGMVALYICGVVWLAYVTGLGLLAAFNVGALPYLLPDLVKVLLAALLGVRLRRTFYRQS